MKYNENYMEILSQIETRRSRALFEAEKKKEQLYIDHPELRSIERKKGDAGLLLFQDQIKGISETEAQEKYDQRLRAIEAERKKILGALGLTDKDFDPQFFCPHCQDTGYVNGQICVCLKEMVDNTLFSQYDMSEGAKEQRFDTFDISIYAVEDRSRAKNIFSQCWQICKAYDTDKNNYLFYGQPGRGKTFMCSCIAGELIKNGKQVIYLTAGHLADSARENVGIRDASKRFLMDHLMNCDLLIIDDLGAEYITDYSESILFDVINTRLLHQRKMIISTNLSLEEIAGAYNPRLSSRINGHFKKVNFMGRDLRNNG